MLSQLPEEGDDQGVYPVKEDGLKEEDFSLKKQ